MGAVARRDRAAAAVVVATILLFLCLALSWHLVAMDHRDGMGLLGGCLCIMAALLLLVAPSARGSGAAAKLVEPPSQHHLPGLVPEPRAPPPPGPLRGDVLLC